MKTAVKIRLEVTLTRVVRGPHEIDPDDLERLAEELVEVVGVDAYGLSAEVSFH